MASDIDIYGLRAAKKIIADMRAEPTDTHPSPGTYANGRKGALTQLSDRIDARIREIGKAAQDQ
jgi:hypothetical protein